jgi:hypothetical protein
MASNFFAFNLFQSLSSNRNSDSENGNSDIESLASLPNSPEDALTHPPPWIRLVDVPQMESTRTVEPFQIMTDQECDEGSSFLSLSSSSMTVEEEDLMSASLPASGGVTILNSVHSSMASSTPSSEYLALTSLSPPPTNRLIIGQDHAASIISLATTETRYEDLSILSLRSLSLASSLGDLSLSLQDPFLRSGDHPLAQAAEEDDSSLISIRLVPMTREEPQELQAALTIENENQDTKVAAMRPWFSHLTSEDDWDRFSENVLDILSAVRGEYEVANNERLLARLIQQEEAMFWSDPDENQNVTALRRRRLQRGLVIIGNAALLLAAPLLAISYTSASRVARL